ncbi:hypothetical protein K525DRAFT_257882 [Schizophyllum commune Loenen D]|nr:hypothetical protein K525DRAFT_257882 [Schizophyllum commune Loenen D]
MAPLAHFFRVGASPELEQDMIPLGDRIREWTEADEAQADAQEDTECSSTSSHAPPDEDASTLTVGGRRSSQQERTSELVQSHVEPPATTFGDQSHSPGTTRPSAQEPSPPRASHDAADATSQPPNPSSRSQLLLQDRTTIQAEEIERYMRSERREVALPRPKRPNHLESADSSSIVSLSSVTTLASVNQAPAPDAPDLTLTLTATRLPSVRPRGILRKPGAARRGGNLSIRFIDEPLIKVISPAPDIVGLPDSWTKRGSRSKEESEEESLPASTPSTPISSESFFDKTPFPRHADLPQASPERAPSAIPFPDDHARVCEKEKDFQASPTGLSAPPPTPRIPHTPLPDEEYEPLPSELSAPPPAPRIPFSPLPDEAEVEDALIEHVEQFTAEVSAVLGRQVTVNKPPTVVPELRALVQLVYPSGYPGPAVLSMRVGTSSVVQAGETWDDARSPFFTYCDSLRPSRHTIPRLGIERISFEIEQSIVGVEAGVMHAHAWGGGDLAVRLVNMARMECPSCRYISVAIV